MQETALSFLLEITVLSFCEFRRIRKTYIDFETRSECRLIWNKYIQMKKKMNSTPFYSGAKADLVIIDDIIPCKTNVSYMDMWSSSLGTVECVQPSNTKPAFSFGMKTVNKQEGNNPMNYATATVTTATTETQDQRKYLTERLREVYNEKRGGLEAHFGLIDDDAPNGPDDLAERLKEGKFIIRGADKDNGRFAYWAWFDLIQWRDPSRKEDAEGFKAAVDELKALRQAALDTIKIDEPKAGLDAVKALEAWTPKGAAN